MQNCAPHCDFYAVTNGDNYIEIGGSIGYLVYDDSVFLHICKSNKKLM